MLKGVLIIIIIIVFSATNLYADNKVLSLPVEKINPGSSLYPFKRLTEKVRSKLYLSKAKNLSYQGKLTERRLSELNFLVENKNLMSLENSSKRFSAQAGDYVDGVVKLNDKSASDNTKQKFADYKIILEKLRDQFPANSSNWLLLQQNIDTLNILQQKIN